MSKTIDEVRIEEKKEELTLTKAQELALSHKGSDLLISAGAGSGKTMILTKKIAQDIANGADIANMLIVTFTKEAANKLKGDIREKLAKELEENPENTKLKDQMLKISTADISTIDSFCYKLVKSNFDKIKLESGAQLDSNFRIGEAGELKVIEYEALDEVLDEFYEAEETDKDFLLVSDCYSSLSNENVLKDNLLELYNSLINTKNSLETIKATVEFEGDFMDSPYGAPLKRVLQDAVDYFKHALEISKIIVDDNDKAYKKYGASVYSDIDFINRLEKGMENPKYSTLCEIFSTYSSVGIGRNSLPAEVDGAHLKYCRDGLMNFVLGKEKNVNGIRPLFFSSNNEDAIFSIKQNAKMSNAIYKVLKRFDMRYEEKKAQYSVCSFNDVSRYALRLLYEEDGVTPSPLADELKEKYSYIYVDEYQDTNSVQDRIFSAFSNNNRFLVGDIKQSIYNFRAAEPEIFTGYRESFVDKELPCDDEKQGRSLFMSENFRCNPEVIDFTNLVTNYLFTNSYGIPYVSKDALKFAKTKNLSTIDQPAEVYLFEKKSKPNEGKSKNYDLELEEYNASETAQADFVAREIKRIFDSKDLPFADKPREIKKSDFAILLRSAKDEKAQKYVDALAKYGIGSELKVNSVFYEKPHILLAISILNVIDNPYKDIFLAGAMRSQIFDFSLEELIEIRSSCKSKGASLYSVVKDYNGNKDIVKKIKDMINTLDDIRRKIRKEGAHNVVAYVLNDMGLLSLCNKDERQDLLKLYNIARIYEGSSFKGLFKFLRYVESNMSGQIRDTIVGDEDDNVKIMTFHAAKGLEFEYCFVCNLEDRIEYAIQKPDIFFDRVLGVAGYVGKDNGLVKYNSLPRKCVDLATSRATLEEEIRMLYVALTRARTKLYVTASISKPEEKVEEYRNAIQSPHNVYNTTTRINLILGALKESKPFYQIYYEDKKLPPKKDIERDGDDGKLKLTADEYLEILKKRFDFKYSQEHLTTLPSKLSISNLYPNVLDGTENETLDVDKSLDTTPKFLLKKETTSATDRGTATHVFLQFCKFDRLKDQGVDNELDILIKDGFIPEEYRGLIDKSRVQFFTKHWLFNDMLNAKEGEIWREFRFNVMLSAHDLSIDPNIQKEKVLVQGVIDCVFKKGEDYILVDYKTDNATVDEIVGKYTSQLNYYARACKKLFGKPVKEAYIYSIKNCSVGRVPLTDVDDGEYNPPVRPTK
ncbi:MAG: UvrD-helicase domain-containing protein [Clostridia bacterium]|nr:UvrD-helicase domain-containing protein [Clostridia bacterium]